MQFSKDQEPFNEFPAFAGIESWCAISGLRRRTTYQEIALGHLRAVKRGKSLLIDVRSGLAWLNALPAAKIRPQRRTGKGGPVTAETK